MGKGKGGGTKYYKAPSKFALRNWPFGTNASQRTGLPTLRKVLQAVDNHAKAAVDKFLHLGNLWGPEIYHLIRMVGVSSDEPIEWPRPERRRAKELAGKCTKLADEIEHVDKNKKWPFHAGMIANNNFESRELPRLLRSYATTWEQLLTRKYRSARSPRNINILRLLDYVK